MSTAERPSGRLPDFFIVGAPKCGTTSMYAYLRQHPQVFMPFHKEPLFFGSDLTRRYGAMTAGEYVALFRDAPAGAVVGEASAWYLYSERAAQEIHAAVPSARIVVMLRNPIDVMYAQHSQLLYNRQESIADFGEALAAEERRWEGRDLPPGPVRPENLYYRRMVRFAEQLERYLDVFGRERVHVIIFDDMRADVARTFADTLAFLDVDEDFRPSFERENPNKEVRSRILQRMTWDPPLLRRLIPRLRRYPLVHWLRARVLEINSRAVPRPAMDPDLRRRLQEELAPEVARLGQLLGRDLGSWTTSPASFGAAARAADVGD